MDGSGRRRMYLQLNQYLTGFIKLQINKAHFGNGSSALIFLICDKKDENDILRCPCVHFPFPTCHTLILILLLHIPTSLYFDIDI